MKRFILFSILFFNALCIFSQTPEVPEITVVTINDEGKVQISWKVSDPSVIDGYVVVRRIFDHPSAIDGTHHDIATVTDGTTTTFVDETIDFGLPNPDVRPESYRVKSFKMNGTDQVVSERMSESHALIHLKQPTFDKCEEKVTLTWSHYVGWGGDLGAYIVYGRASGATVFEQLATLSANDTTFVHESPTVNADYEYYISALHPVAKLFTRSNVKSVSTAIPQTPDLFRAEYGTVTKEEKVRVSFSLGASSDVTHYVLQKSKSAEDGFEDIEVVEPTETDYVYIDEEAEIDEMNYYRLKAIGSCGEPIGETGVAQNIVSTAIIEDKQTGINRITWSGYKHWPEGVDRYELYRSIDNNQPEQVGNYTPTTLRVQDNIGLFRFQPYKGKTVAGKFCYFVRAISRGNALSGEPIYSDSEENCVHYPKFIMMANAINPTSEDPKNRVFRPKVAYVNSYKLIIYNRWGDSIFSTQDAQVGWDGTSEGKLVLPGAYVYYIEFRDSHGDINQYRGMISVIY